MSYFWSLFHLMTKRAKQEFLRRHFSNECTVVLTDVQKSLDLNNIIFPRPPKALVEKNYTCIIYSDKLVNKSNFGPVEDNDIDTCKCITDTAEQSQTSKETNIISAKLMQLRSNQKGQSHRCLGCRVIFNDLSEVENHVHIIYSCKYLCKYCSQQFKTKNLFADHVMNHLITNKPNNSDSTTPHSNNLNDAYCASSIVQHVPSDHDIRETIAEEHSSHVKHTTDTINTKKVEKHNLAKNAPKRTSVKNGIQRVSKVNTKINLSTYYDDLFNSVINSATEFVDNRSILSNTNSRNISVDFKNIANTSTIGGNNDPHMIANCNDNGNINDLNCSPNAQTPNLISNHALAILPETNQTGTVQMHSSPSYIEYYSHDFPSGAKFSSLRPDQIFDCDLCTKRFASKIAIDQHKISHYNNTVDTKKIKLEKNLHDRSDDPKSASQPVNHSLLGPHISQMGKDKSISQLKDPYKRICDIQSSEPHDIEDKLPQYFVGSQASTVKSSAQMDNIAYKQGNFLSDNHSTVPQQRKLAPINPTIENKLMPTKVADIGQHTIANNALAVPKPRKIVQIKPKPEIRVMGDANIDKYTVLKPGINGYVDDSGNMSKNTDFSTKETFSFNFHTKGSEFITGSSTTNTISSNINSSQNDKTSTSTVTNNCKEMNPNVTNKNASNVQSKILILRNGFRLSHNSPGDKVKNKGTDIIQEEQNIQLNTSDGVILLRPTDLTDNTQLISSLPAEDLNEGCLLLTSQDWRNMTAAQNPIYYASNFHLAVPPLSKISSAKNKNEKAHIKKEYTETSDTTSLIKITKNKSEVTTCSKNKTPIIINKINSIKRYPTAASSNGYSVIMSIPSTIAPDKPLISPKKNTSVVQSTNLPMSFSTESNKADCNEGGLNTKSLIKPEMTLLLDGTKVSSQNTPSPVISNILLPLDILQEKNTTPVVPQKEQNNKIKEASENLALHRIEPKNLQCIPRETLKTNKGCEILTSKTDIISLSVQEPILSLPSTHSASARFTEASLEKSTMSKTALYCQKESLRKIFNDENFPVTNDETIDVFYNMYKERAEQLKKENGLDITDYLKKLEENYLHCKAKMKKANDEHVKTSEFILPLITNVCTVTDEGLKENTNQVDAPQVSLLNECIQNNPNKHNYCETELISKNDKLETPERDIADNPKERMRQIVFSQLHLLNSWKENYLKQLENNRTVRDDHKYSELPSPKKTVLSNNEAGSKKMQPELLLPKKTVLSNKDAGSKIVQPSASGMILPIISSVFTVTEESSSEKIANITHNSVVSMALDNNGDASSHQLQLQTNKELIQNTFERAETIRLSKASLSGKASSIFPNCNDTATDNDAVTQITNPEMKGRIETHSNCNRLITDINEYNNSSDNIYVRCMANQRSHIDSEDFKSLQSVKNVGTIKKNTQQKNVHTLPSRVPSNSYALDQIFLINEKWPNEDDDFKI